MRRLLLVAVLVLSGCGGNRIDPPPHGEDEIGVETNSDSDSLAVWARRTRELWAAGDSAAAGALARKAFGGAWAQAEDARASAQDATTTERLPEVRKDLPPSGAQVIDALTRVGLAVDIVESHGTPTVWQVLVSDPVGSATARTEFWAWRDPHGFSAVVQGLPKDAPARMRYGPDAVGDLASRSRSDGGAELASAWARPRSRGGLEVALATRPRGDGEHFRVTSNRVLPVDADTVLFEDSGALIVIGGGGRDPMFDECPTCPHLERVQRYTFKNGQWSLGEEKIAPTPYAAFVSFMHALREGGDPLPYASSPLVIEQATTMGLELGRGPLRAAPGTLATDPMQRYRTGGASAIEVTLSNATGRWVVDDVRPTQIVIE